MRSYSLHQPSAHRAGSRGAAVDQVPQLLPPPAAPREHHQARAPSRPLQVPRRRQRREGGRLHRVRLLRLRAWILITATYQRLEYFGGIRACSILDLCTPIDSLQRKKPKHSGIWHGTKPEGRQYLRDEQDRIRAAKSIAIVGGGALGIRAFPGTFPICPYSDFFHLPS